MIKDQKMTVKMSIKRLKMVTINQENQNLSKKSMNFDQFGSILTNLDRFWLIFDYRKKKKERNLQGQAEHLRCISGWETQSERVEKMQNH